MTTVRSPNPPVLVERDGRWYVEIMLDGGQDVVQAPIGDGAWLVQQLVEKLVLPRMRGPARQPQKSDN